MGPPIMTFIHENAGRFVCVRLAQNGRFNFYGAPEGTRDISVISLDQLRPYPAMDAMQMLSRVSKIAVRDLLQEENQHGRG